MPNAKHMSGFIGSNETTYILKVKHTA